MAPVVANNEDREARIECHVGQLRLLLLHHRLRANRLVLVHVQIVDVRLSVSRDRREYRGGIRRPCHVAHSGVEVEDEHGISGEENGQKDASNINDEEATHFLL